MRRKFCPMITLSIGQLSQETATPSPTIRYYETLGLLPRPHRGPGGQRRYGPADVARLNFIRTRRALGFPLAEVAKLLAVCGPEAQPCNDARKMAEAQLGLVRARMAELQRTEQTLLAQIAACEAECGDGFGAGCLLIPAQ